MNHFLTLTDVPIANQRVIIREDFNVPIENGVITSDARIKAALETIEYARQAKARILILSHLGRPTEGQVDTKYSLAPVAKRLAELLHTPVRLIPDWLAGMEIAPGEVALAENVRFLAGEAKNDDALAQKMAACCDVFVMDAFAVAHRANASSTGIAKYAPIACAGLLLAEEINALSQALIAPKHPVVAIIGGAKVSTKMIVLSQLLNKVDQLIVGGGIANTLLAAQGFPVGRSLVELDFLPQAKALLTQAQTRGCQIPLPVDAIVAKELSKDAKAETKAISAIAADDMILDIGPQTELIYQQLIKTAGTIIWNGPVGVFEIPQFSQGTKQLALDISHAEAYSLAGGGDTIAALEKFGLEKKISYLSTGGGAFIEWIEGKTLPALAALSERATSIR